MQNGEPVVDTNGRRDFAALGDREFGHDFAVDQCDRL